MIALCHRFASLDRSDRQLMLEVMALMPLVWMGLYLLRFPALRRALDTYVRLRTIRQVGSEAAAVGRVRWAIHAVTARVPGATCLVQALTADAILRRLGLACDLHIGVRARSNGTLPIEAHAWVECHGLVAVGAIDGLADFKVLAPSRSA